MNQIKPVPRPHDSSPPNQQDVRPTVTTGAASSGVRRLMRCVLYALRAARDTPRDRLPYEPAGRQFLMYLRAALYWSPL